MFLSWLMPRLLSRTGLRNGVEFKEKLSAKSKQGCQALMGGICHSAPVSVATCCVWMCWEHTAVRATECPQAQRLFPRCPVPLCGGDACTQRQQQLVGTFSCPDEDRHFVISLVSWVSGSQPKHFLLPSTGTSWNAWGHVWLSQLGHTCCWLPVGRSQGCAQRPECAAWSPLHSRDYLAWSARSAEMERPYRWLIIFFLQGFCLLLKIVFIATRPICFL